MRLAKQSQFIPLQNGVYFITLPFLVRKIFTFYIIDVLIFKCPIPGPNGEGGDYFLLSNEKENSPYNTPCRDGGGGGGGS